MSMLMPEMYQWKAIAERGVFRGVPISEMSRDELLAVIGYQIEEKKQSDADWQREIAVWSPHDSIIEP